MAYIALTSPPPDIELGIPRPPLPCAVALPSAGIGPNTGLMLFICGWGQRVFQPYIADKLLPYLADAHDCVAASADYLGIAVNASNGFTLHPTPGWMEAVPRHYGLPGGGTVNDIMNQLVHRGVTRLSDQFPLLIERYSDYQKQGVYESFGFMPAVDNIALLAKLLSTYPVRRDRLYAFGTSYGGYVAWLLQKFLPNTFHAIIDNSGFACALPKEMAQLDLDGGRLMEAGPITFRVVNHNPWTVDENSPFFLSPAILDIRDCRIADHYTRSRTILMSYHALADEMVPIAVKRQAWQAIAPFVDLRAHAIGDDGLDGRAFKENGHGFKASLRSLAGLALSAIPHRAEDAQTDFSRASVVRISVPGRRYVFDYRPDHSFGIGLEAG